MDRWLPGYANPKDSYQAFQKAFKTDGLLVLVTEKQEDNRKGMLSDSLVRSFRNLDGVLGISKWPQRYVMFKKKPKPDFNVSVISLAPNSREHPFRPDVIDCIRSTLDTNKLTYYLGGSGVINQAINQQTTRDTSMFLGLGLAILVVILLLWTQSLKAVILSLAVALIGVFSIFNVSILLNIPVSMAHSILPVMVLFYSISISMHILAHNGNYKKVIKPTIWVVLTTIAGFSAFAFSKIPLLKDFAILGIGGILSIFLGSLLVYFPKVNFRKKAFSLLQNSYPRKLPGFIQAMVLLVGLFLFSGLGIKDLKAEIHSLSVLSEKDKAYKDHLFIENNVGPYFPIDFIIDGKYLKRPEVVKWIHDVYSLKSVGATISYHRIPKLIDLKGIGYQSSLEPEKYRVTFLVPLLSTSSGEKLIDSITNISNAHFDKEQPKLAGFMNSYRELSVNLLKEFRQSIILGFLIVFGTFLVFIRKIKIVFISILINMLPITVILATMGWLKIRLDMVTIPIACLLLGVVVDDTIHLLYWLKKENDVMKALKRSGPGMLSTSIAMSVGFSVLLVSDAPPIRYFGLLSVLAILIALIADLFLLPVLITKFLKQPCDDK